MVGWVQPSNATKRIVAVTLVATAILSTLVRLSIRIRTHNFWLDDACESDFPSSSFVPNNTVFRGDFRCCLLTHDDCRNVAKERSFSKQLYHDYRLLVNSSCSHPLQFQYFSQGCNHGLSQHALVGFVPVIKALGINHNPTGPPE
jgi:hypothetical protein